jgi:hypothetical protein
MNISDMRIATRLGWSFALMLVLMLFYPTNRRGIWP